MGPKMKIDEIQLASCLASLVNMQGGMVVIPKNERELIEDRSVTFQLNKHTGTVTIQIEPEEGGFEESEEDYV